MKIRIFKFSNLVFVFFLVHIVYGSYNSNFEHDSWGNDARKYRPVDYMVDLTNYLGLNVLYEHNFLNENNIAFSPYGLSGILIALYEGVDGASCYQIKQTLGLPNDRNVLRVGFRDIHRRLRSYFIPKEGFLAGLAFNNENVTFKQEYKDILRFYGYDFEMPNTLTTEATSKPGDASSSDGTTQPTVTSRFGEDQTTNMMTTEVETTTFEPSPVTAALSSPSPSDEESDEEETTVRITTTTTRATTTTSRPITTTPSPTTTTARPTTTTTSPTTTTARPTTTTTSPTTTTARPTTTTTSATTTTARPITTTPETTTPYTRPTTAETKSPETVTEPVQTTMADIPTRVTRTTSFTRPTEPASDSNESNQNELNAEDNNNSNESGQDNVATTRGTTVGDRFEQTTNFVELTTTPMTTKSEPIATTATSTTTAYVPTTTAPIRTTTFREEDTTPFIMEEIVMDGSTDSGISTTTQRYESTSAPTTTVQTTVSRPETSTMVSINMEDATKVESSEESEENKGSEPNTEGNSEQDDKTETSTANANKDSNEDEDSSKESKALTSEERRDRQKKSLFHYEFAAQHPGDHFDFYRPVFLRNPSYDSRGLQYHRSFLANGYSRIRINYMTYEAVLEYAYIPYLKSMALKLPLDTSEYYLLILLPEYEFGVNQLVKDLHHDRAPSLKQINDMLRNTYVKAWVPSFMLKGFVVLTSDLQKLGICDVFEPRQDDFTPMTNEKNIYVRNIEQAITVTIRKYMEPPMRKRYVQHQAPVEFAATHPFLYFVMDSSIHVALMAGKIVNPLNSRII